jgi:hypothetical protein
MLILNYRTEKTKVIDNITVFLVVVGYYRQEMAEVDLNKVMSSELRFCVMTTGGLCHLVPYTMENE